MKWKEWYLGAIISIIMIAGLIIIGIRDGLQ